MVNLFSQSQQSIKRSFLKKLFKKVTGLGFHGLFAGFDFIEGFGKAKEGFRMGLQKNAKVDLKNILAGTGLASLGLGLAFEVGRYIHKRQVLSNAKEQAIKNFEQVIASDPHLQQYPKEELMQYLNTLLQVAPNVAADPVLLRQALKQIATYGGVDPQSAKVLSELDEQIMARKVLHSVEAGDVTKALSGAAGLLGNYAGLLGGGQ